MHTAVPVTPPPYGPPPAFDRDAYAMLAQQEQVWAPKQTWQESVLEYRRLANLAYLSDEDASMGGYFHVHERDVPGPVGEPAVTVIICTPTQATEPVGVLYLTHGGAMVLGHHRGEELRTGLQWAQQLGLAVVSVNYRLAPEHPHPAPIEDCYAGLVWVAEHASELGVDPQRIVVAGASAGGGLSAGLALLARDRGGPHLAGHMSICPMLDERLITISSHQLADRGGVTRPDMENAWTSLLGDARRTGPVSAYASPSHATDLSGLPPVFIDVGSAELFRDEAVEYATRIWAAGGDAELHVWPGGYHGFEALAPHTALAQSAVSTRVPWLRRILDR